MSKQLGHNEALPEEPGAGQEIHPWRIFAQRYPHIVIDPWQRLPEGVESRREGDKVWLCANLGTPAARRSALARVLAAIVREEAGQALSDPRAEREASNALAARWLIPLEKLADAMRRDPWDHPWHAEALWCDEKAVAARLSALAPSELEWLKSRIRSTGAA